MSSVFYLSDRSISIIALVISIIAILLTVIIFWLSVRSRLLIEVKKKLGVGEKNDYGINIINIKYRERTIKDLYIVIKPKYLCKKIKNYFKNASLKRIILPLEIRLEKNDIIDKKLHGDGGILKTNLFISDEYEQKLIDAQEKIRVFVIDTHGKKHSSNWIKF